MILPRTSARETAAGSLGLAGGELRQGVGDVLAGRQVGLGEGLVEVARRLLHGLPHERVVVRERLHRPQLQADAEDPDVGVRAEVVLQELLDRLLRALLLVEVHPAEDEGDEVPGARRPRRRLPAPHEADGLHRPLAAVLGDLELLGLQVRDDDVLLVLDHHAEDDLVGGRRGLRRGRRGGEQQRAEDEGERGTHGGLPESGAEARPKRGPSLEETPEPCQSAERISGPTASADGDGVDGRDRLAALPRVVVHDDREGQPLAALRSSRSRRARSRGAACRSSRRPAARPPCPLMRFSSVPSTPAIGSESRKAAAWGGGPSPRGARRGRAA